MISWTIYDHPSDFPEQFVARKMIIDADVVLATEEHFADVDLIKVRQHVRERMVAEQGYPPIGFTRHENDDPVILETWM